MEANPAALKDLGANSIDELRGRRDSDILSPEQAAIGLESRRKMRACGGPLTENVHFDFNNRDYLMTSASIGKDFVISSRIDITDTKRAQRDLQTTLDRFYRMLSEIPYGILLVKSDDRVEFANQTFCEIYHLKDCPSELSNLSSSEMIDEIRSSYQDPEAAVARISEIVRLGQPVKGEEVELVGDRTFLRDYIPISFGEYYTGRLWIHVDISDRKKAERSLAENEVRYRGLFENMQDLVVLRRLVFDMKGEIIGTEILDANIAALKARGVTVIDGLRNKDDRELYSPDMADVILNQARRMKAEGKSVTEEVHFDANDRDYLSTSAPLGHDLLITTSIDITDRKKTEDNLKRSNEELQQFAYLSSHDLQEPLRMVVSYLSLLEKRYKDQLDPSAQEYIKNAVEGGTRMRQLIDDLLEYSRLDTTGKEFVQVNMNEVLESTIKMLKVPIEENRADIFVGSLPTIEADQLQMSQLMQNLVGNAIKFHGSERPMIQIVSKPGVREWTFSVKDNGIGLNTQYVDKIFQMFQRLHTKEEYPGTGVGLAIAKKIVERHGGRIWVESEEGKGATFFFTIPKLGGGKK